MRTGQRGTAARERQHKRPSLVKKLESGVRKHDSGLLSNPYRVSFSSPVAFQAFYGDAWVIFPPLWQQRQGCAPPSCLLLWIFPYPVNTTPPAGLCHCGNWGFLSRSWPRWQFGVNFPSLPCVKTKVEQAEARWRCSSCETEHDYPDFTVGVLPPGVGFLCPMSSYCDWQAAGTWIWVKSSPPHISYNFANGKGVMSAIIAAACPLHQEYLLRGLYYAAPQKRG